MTTIRIVLDTPLILKDETREYVQSVYDAQQAQVTP